MEFSMYSQRCINAASVAAYSACDVLRLDASPYLSPCTLAKPSSAKQHICSLHALIYLAIQVYLLWVTRHRELCP